MHEDSEFNLFIQKSIIRYANCDWGNTSRDGCLMNEYALNIDKQNQKHKSEREQDRESEQHGQDHESECEQDHESECEQDHEPERIFACYKQRIHGTERVLYIITEPDRSRTTIMLPSDY